VKGPIVTCPNCGTRNRLATGREGLPRCAKCHELLPWIVDADAAGFDAELQAPVPVVVDLWAPWCGPCRWIAPIVEEFARSHAGRVKVVKLDIDTAPEIANRYEVRGIPLLLVIRDGREVDRLAGAPPKQQLQAWLERAVDTRTEASA
jgi:thioredoxin 2